MFATHFDSSTSLSNSRLTRLPKSRSITSDSGRWTMLRRSRFFRLVCFMADTNSFNLVDLACIYEID